MPRWAGTPNDFIGLQLRAPRTRLRRAQGLPSVTALWSIHGVTDTLGAPSSEADLLSRAERLAGQTLGQVAEEFGQTVPGDLTRSKGFVGQLLERALGATAGSKAVPDFERIGVELKSIPVDHEGFPVETTFVCTIPLLDVGSVEWERSRVRSKLQRVLWVPVIGVRGVPVSTRVIGSPLLWSPSPRDEADLRWDWEQLAGIIGTGGVEEITGHMGRYLQVRPKARDSKARRRAVDPDGRRIQALPRGFYLRTAFTARLLEQHFLMPNR